MQQSLSRQGFPFNSEVSNLISKKNNETAITPNDTTLHAVKRPPPSILTPDIHLRLSEAHQKEFFALLYTRWVIACTHTQKGGRG